MKALAMRALFLAIVISMTLAGCRSTGDGDPATQAREIRMPGEHALRIGQSFELPDGSTLTYLRLVADSRCRPDVQCIRAGDADIELRWHPANGIAQTAVLNSDPRNRRAPNAVRFDQWQVGLRALDWQTPPTATLAVARVD